MFKKLLHSSLLKEIKFPSLNFGNLLHTTSSCQTKKWEEYNKKIYPPQLPNESRRPAYICHCKENIKYSYKKLWYIACLIRGMTVDEAIKQLSFVQKKGATVVKETLLEAQKMAVEDHNVEHKTNLWVSESFIGKGVVVKGLRRHARHRFGRIHYQYTHYYVTLEEGSPPEHYYHYRRPKSGEERLCEWLERMRKRTVINSL